jgi:hypothetical protein
VSEPFFITGLPRSRTGWLAALLSGAHGVCLHDVLGGCAGVEDLKSQISDFKAAGVSDPALALVWRDVAAAWPEAKWVVVRRDKFDAARSYAAFLARHGWGMAWDQVRATIEAWDAELAALLWEPQTTMVDYDDLDDAGEARRLCDFLRVGFDPGRFEMMRRLNVQTIPGKAPFQVAAAPFHAWMKQRKEKVWAQEH